MLKPADIRREWPWVRPGLERAIEKSAETLWPEDVYAAVVNGQAQLFTAPDGFVVWKMNVCPYTGNRTLWVWFVWGEGGDMIARYQGQLAELAKHAEADRLAFQSARRGYERVLDDSWSVARVEYERVI